MSSSYLSILQWNMGDTPYSKKKRSDQPEKKRLSREERAQILTDLLEESTPTIVTLQEVDRVMLTFANLLKYDIYYGSKGLVTLVLRNLYRNAANNSTHNRCQFLALESPNIRERGLKIVNIHLPVLNISDHIKRENARDIVRYIDTVKLTHESKLTIVSGDFNFPPYDEVMIQRSGFHANRDLRHVSTLQSTIRQALYNTSWSIFSGTCGALGTYYRNELPHGPWLIPDQIIIDPALAVNASIEVKVITEVKGKSLATTRVAMPNKAIVSDHFPLLVSINKNSLL